MKLRNLAAHRRPAPLLVALAALSAGSYLLISRSINGFGYPLDDAWIHQSYARNLAESGEWSFQPGSPSAGSTSPLWTVFLALGYLLGAPPLVWTFILGVVSLGLTGWVGVQWLSDRRPASGAWSWAAGLVIVFEWHLVWASLSGMETLVQGLLFAAFFWRLESGARGSFHLGALIGIGVWLRPDSLTLLFALALAVLIRSQAKLKEYIKEMAPAILGFSLFILPYLALNLSLDGTPWPSTYYAKQAEYVSLRQSSFFIRWANQPQPLLAGVGVVLLPGLVSSISSLRVRNWARLIPLAWVLSFWALYALRLPVTYQHGRYAIPSLPVLVVLGLDGLLGELNWGARSFVRRVVWRVWILGLASSGVVFWWIGGNAYAKDVAIIETEMVAAAKWIQANTEPGALVAAHDIGALGYYGQRQLVDLAGLVSPEVIPILRNEVSLEAFIDQQGADYLMTFPNWYPGLVQRGELVFETQGRFSPAAGGENMTVYRWKFAP